MRLLAATVPLVLLLATPAVAQSVFDGTWKIDTGAAKFDPKPDVLTLSHGQYQCASCVPAYTVPADGTFHPIPGHPYADEVAISVPDARTIVERDRKGGKVVGESTSTVSADGRTLAVSFTDMSAPNGKIVRGAMTETRVGPAPAGAHAGSGSWRQNRMTGMSEDALRFTIRTEGDAFHFASAVGYSADGRIGGGYVTEKGDIAGTMIKYERVDPRTLRATEMRAGKVVGVSMITASPDGRTLTNTSRDLIHGTTNVGKATKQ